MERDGWTNERTIGYCFALYGSQTAGGAETLAGFACLLRYQIEDVEEACLARLRRHFSNQWQPR
jgi:hypothetical protein